jgi:hypothetical protein
VVQALHHVGAHGFTYLDDHFVPDMPDPVWLQEVGERGWVAVTRDKAIRRKPVERAAVIAGHLRLFVFNQARPMSALDYLDSLTSYWRRILEWSGENAGPAIILIGANGDFRAVDLLGDETPGPLETDC